MSLVNKVANRMRRAIDEPWMWLGSDKPQVIAAGQSHRMALVHALRSGLVDLPVAVLTSQPGHDRPTDGSYWEKVAAQPREIPLALLWVGNEMNANFLLEQEPPVRTADASDAEGKMLVPAEMFRAFVFQKRTIAPTARAKPGQSAERQRWYQRRSAHISATTHLGTHPYPDIIASNSEGTE